MNLRIPPKPGASTDSIDFEFVTVDDARAAHDELPAGVGSLPTLVPGYWEQRRRKPVPSDRALTGAAIEWLIALPPALRPAQLAERFPRIVNTIAEAQTTQDRLLVLAGLLDDRRGHRGGFCLEVRHEIDALYDAAVRLHAGPDAA